MASFSLGLLLVSLASGVSELKPDTRVFETGRLIENVQSATSTEQRFTLYLPPGFDPGRPTPVIYLMDPRGRARVPAKLFQAAAERYGYILASSNMTATDGPIGHNLRAMQAMWDDTHAWFTIDPRRTYVAGFSGTARTASLIARNRPAITGIIGAGAGFHPDVQPSKDMPFLYFGAVGDVDYNFHEIEDLEHGLAALDLPHRLERFSGPHSWMPPALALRAVEWLELRAMELGSRPRDAALVDAWWERDEASAREQIAAGRVLDAARSYAAMVRDFNGLRDTAEARRTAEALASSPAAQDQLKARRAATKKYHWWAREAMEAIAAAFPEGANGPALPASELATVLNLSDLKRTAAKGAPAAALEARRRLNQIEVQLGFYLPHEALAREELARAEYYLSLAVEIDDTSPVSWYLAAQTHAGLQMKRKALAALQRAVDAGFRDLALLEADAAFRKLRPTPEYAAIVDLLRAQGDHIDSLTVDRPPIFVLR
jgi:hypothetical protein